MKLFFLLLLVILLGWCGGFLMRPALLPCPACPEPAYNVDTISAPYYADTLAYRARIDSLSDHLRQLAHQYDSISNQSRRDSMRYRAAQAALDAVPDDSLSAWFRARYRR